MCRQLCGPGSPGKYSQFATAILLRNFQGRALLTETAYTQVKEWKRLKTKQNSKTALS